MLKTIFCHTSLSLQSAGESVSFGICFIDTSIGVFHLGQFVDDRHCSRLRTLFAHHPPVQVCFSNLNVYNKYHTFLDAYF
jgi:DNA mismatch repair protein MSH6